jgi:hypothetical protein
MPEICGIAGAYSQESATCVLNHSLQTVYARQRVMKVRAGFHPFARNQNRDRKIREVA